MTTSHCNMSFVGATGSSILARTGHGMLPALLLGSLRKFARGLRCLTYGTLLGQ